MNNMNKEEACPARVALTEDETLFSRRIIDELGSSGWCVKRFEGADSLRGIIDDSFDAVLIMNPNTHQARSIRGQLDSMGGLISRIPVVAVVEDIELAQDSALKYCDDFINSPAGTVELAIRIKMWALKKGSTGRVISCSELVVNLESRQVFLSGKPVDLTYKEYELLRMMAATPGRAYSRDEILRNVWGYDYIGGTRTVDVHVRRLRAKIEGARTFIDTVHGVGYRFAKEEAPGS